MEWDPSKFSISNCCRGALVYHRDINDCKVGEKMPVKSRCHQKILFNPPPPPGNVETVDFYNQKKKEKSGKNQREHKKVKSHMHEMRKHNLFEVKPSQSRWIIQSWNKQIKRHTVKVPQRGLHTPPRTSSGPFQPWTSASLTAPAHSLMISLWFIVITAGSQFFWHTCKFMLPQKKGKKHRPARSFSMDNSVFH